ncbi:MAG TPA: adenine phosphoribosyltransferase [Bacteroidia bacterium]|nr:adenine phosphoribosyltransferase [Bacteroidia bacterium]
MLEQEIKSVIRDVPNFPKEGIIFKDITPILLQPALCEKISAEIANNAKTHQIDAVLGIESRGFLFGMTVARLLNVPFIPIRKAGKLPYTTIREEYDLEYGSAVIEMHSDALNKGAKVMIHDDLLATGGTAVAACKLVEKAGASVSCFSFIVSLDFLNGKDKLKPYSQDIFSLVNY